MTLPDLNLTSTNIAAGKASNDALTANNRFGGATKGFTLPKDDLLKAGLLGLGIFAIYKIYSAKK